MDWKTRNNQTTSSWRNNGGLGGSGGGKPPRGLRRTTPGCLVLLLLPLVLLLALAGCGSYGEAHNHNAPAIKTDVQLNWERLDSPGNYHTIIHACFGVNGLYLTQADNNSATVIPNDPMCAR